MDLTNEFTVPVPVERAWEVLNDVELIAPCMPGAELQEIEGDEHRGILKVKVGPITAQYKGAATFEEQDEVNRRVVLSAAGRDIRGQGSASAVITATMTETDGRTHVQVDSDVTIKGKVAQFGRGMIAEVSANLVDQFVECLEGKLEAEPTGDTPGDPAAEEAKAQAEATEATSTAPGPDDTPATVGDPAAEAAKDEEKAAVGGSPEVRRIESTPAEPLDLMGVAGSSVAKRVVPIVVLVVVLLLIGKRRSSTRRS